MFITTKVDGSNLLFHHLIKSPYNLSDKKRAYLIKLLSAAEELSRGEASWNVSSYEAYTFNYDFIKPSTKAVTVKTHEVCWQTLNE